MLDQPERPLGDARPEGLDAGGDVVSAGSMAMPTSCKQGSQQELLVVGPDVARQVKDLQAVKKGVTLGVVLGVLLD